MTRLVAAVRRCYPQLALAMFVLGAILCAILTAPSASAAVVPDTRVPNATATLCGDGQWKWADHGQEVLYNDVFNPSDRQCVSDPSDGDSFTVTRSTTPTDTWQGFPELFEGCWFGVCAQSGPFPARLSTLRSVTEHLLDTYPAAQTGDASNDIWFSHGDNIKGHPDAAEVMLWATWRNVPRCCGRLVRIGTRNWWLEQWYDHKGGVTWHYIQLRDMRDRAHDLYTVNVEQVFRWLEGRRWLKPWWWLTAFQAGFELVQHGRGDAETFPPLTVTKAGA